MNTKKPLVSVIIPNYNHARYLDQRISTVLNQTYQNFEVIILDDCSTDESLDVIKKYKDNPHISQVVVNEHNSGNTFVQWYKGINLANGELCWIAESDDYCELNFLEELVSAYLHRSGTVLAYNTTLVTYDNGRYGNKIHEGRNQYLSGNCYLKRYLSLFNFVMNASCAIFNKDAALNLTPTFLQYKGAGDYMFWVQMAEQGNVAIVNKKLSYFFRHEGTVTDTFDRDGSNPLACKLIYDYIESKVHISELRKHLVFAFHRKWFNHGYINECIYRQVSETWTFSKYQSRFDEKLLLFCEILRRRFNIFV